MPDGSVRNIHFVARAVRDEAGQLEFNGALLDVTAAKRAEEELHKARAELAHVTRVTTLGELTASIAHEINQPLAAHCSKRQREPALAQPRRPPYVEEALAPLEPASSEDGLRTRRRDHEHSCRFFSKGDEGRAPRSTSTKLVREILGLTQGGFRTGPRASRARTELADGLPGVPGQSGLSCNWCSRNLITNAIDAMSAVKDRARVFAITSPRSARPLACGSQWRIPEPASTPQRRSCLRHVLHHQILWHGHGAFHLPLHRRSPRWAAVGVVRAPARLDV